MVCLPSVKSFWEDNEISSKRTILSSLRAQIWNVWQSQCVSILSCLANSKTSLCHKSLTLHRARSVTSRYDSVLWSTTVISLAKSRRSNGFATKGVRGKQLVRTFSSRVTNLTRGQAHSTLDTSSPFFLPPSFPTDVVVLLAC